MNQETTEWIDALLSGTLSPDRFAQLQDRLRQDPVAFEHYCVQAELHGRLEWELGHPVEAIAPLAAARRPRWRLWVGLAAAAVFLIGLLLGPGVHQVPRPLDPVVRANGDRPRIQYVARLTHATNVRWVHGNPQIGEWIPSGPLELSEGSVQIAFDSGASLRLQAPARLYISSPTYARLELGKSIVEIPDLADGFVIGTPTGDLRRPNSRFGVAVEEDGRTEIHVIEGEVELNPKRGSRDSLKLSKEETVCVTNAGVVPDSPRYAVGDFGNVARTDSALLPKSYLHWSFDDVDVAQGTFEENGRHPAGTPSYPASALEMKDASHPALVPGRFGNAVKLEGVASVLATRFPGYPGNAPRTVAFWVMIPVGTSDDFCYSMLSWGTSRTSGGKWQIAWNNGKTNSGTKGAIRTEIQDGYNIGSVDLRDGKWHHIAVVFPGGPQSTTADIRHYIDGRLEASTAVLSLPVNTRVDEEASFPLILGHRLDSDGDYSFRGTIDELYVFPVALLPESIEDLYLYNTPPDLQ